GPADRKNFRPPLPEGGEDLAARGREGPLDPERLAAEAPSEGEPVPLLEAPGLDVWERRLAQSAARPVAAPPPFDPTLAVLRRCLASGDGRSGRVRLELGEGAFEGSAVDVVYDGVRRELSVVVELGAEADGNVAERLASLRRRL